MRLTNFLVRSPRELSYRLPGDDFALGAPPPDDEALPLHFARFAAGPQALPVDAGRTHDTMESALVSFVSDISSRSVRDDAIVQRGSAVDKIATKLPCCQLA